MKTIEQDPFKGHNEALMLTPPDSPPPLLLPGVAEVKLLPAEVPEPEQSVEPAA